MAENPDWRTRFRELLPLYGHRNWIVVADAAYPAQVGAIEVVATNEGHATVVRDVMRALQGARHVRPVVYLDEELHDLTEDLSDGVAETRAAISSAIHGLSCVQLPHEDLLKRLGTAAQSFRVLVLKTTGTVPYSSVFIELECGYWSPEQEDTLRRLTPPD